MPDATIERAPTSGLPAAPPPSASVGAVLWSASSRTRLVRLCSTIVQDAAAAEDLAQETLLEAWRHQHRLTDPSGADAWLSAIARNVCRRWLRARGRAAVPTSAPEDHLDKDGEAHDLDAVLEREEIVELLERALALLPAATRDALVAHYVDERSHAEIAEQLGSSTDAVSMRVSRGRNRLRYLLETRFAEDALAEGWVRRGEHGWRPTRLRCLDCGKTTVSLRHDATEVAFRCQTCDPHGLSTRLPLDVPVFADLIGGLRRPSALFARVSSWTRGYWASSYAGSATPYVTQCVRCEASVVAMPYTREERLPWAGRHGWYATCSVCGEQVSGSVAGLAYAQPEVQAVRRREQTLRMLPVRDVVRDDQPAKVVSFSGSADREVAGVVFLRDSLQLVHVWSAAGR